jgi:hypothetical protein
MHGEFPKNLKYEEKNRLPQREGVFPTKSSGPGASCTESELR